LNYLDGRSSIEALLDDLATPDWVSDVTLDTNNHVQSLFFAHQKQVELFRINPDILMMDCTYRTNRYRLPLLHILGCTSLGKFFSVGFCFLCQETELAYHWAVATFFRLIIPSTLPRVFISDQEIALKSAARILLLSVPQLLCVWHIEKNILIHAQLAWRNADGNTPQEKEIITQKRDEFMGRWKQLVYVKTESEFNIKWAQFLSDYSSQIELCNYLKEYQYPIRSQWAAPWTSRYRHFGTVTSSPIEGMHKVLKDYVQTSQGNLSLSFLNNLYH
jgi:hypothetical protein